VTLDASDQAWTAAKHTKSVVLLEDFIRQYGNNFYASLARERLAERIQMGHAAKSEGSSVRLKSWGTSGGHVRFPVP